MKSIFKYVLFTLCSVGNPIFSTVEETTISEAKRDAVSTVILGGGVGALTSALYLSRAGLDPLVIEGPIPGGLLTQSHIVQNWPGILEINGTELTEKIRIQAAANGTRFRNEEVIAVDFSKRPFIITTRSLDTEGQIHQIQANTCIIAMGTQPNFLGVPGETGSQGYWGKGVTNCAICDGSLYRDKVVGVVGGGDSAVLEALYLANIAKEVHVFVRKDSLKTVEEKRAQALAEKPNVKILYNTQVKGIKGDGEKLTQVTLKTGSNEDIDFALDGLFLAIGSSPNSGLFQNVLNLDQKGYICLAKDQQTHIEGVYAIGDIVDPFYKQAISAAGDGAKAALQAQTYLSDRAVIKNGDQPQQQIPEKSHTPIEITSVQQFQKELRESKVPVLVDFYASWCGPCKRVSPIIDTAAQELVGKVKTLKVNVDQVRGLSASYQIKAMPTVLLITPAGEVKERRVGIDPIVKLISELKSRP